MELALYKSRIKHDMKTACNYMKRKPRKHIGEMALVDKAFSEIDNAISVLDIPCGCGRISIHLAKKGFQCTGSEISDAMISIAKKEIAKENLFCDVDKIDIEKMEYDNESFDAIICFRLFHHFPTSEIRKRVIDELCRVAKKYVLISYFSPLSFTSIKRHVRTRIGGKRSKQYDIRLSNLRQYFSNNQFVFVKDYAVLRFIHTLHLAVFKRDC